MKRIALVTVCLLTSIFIYSCNGGSESSTSQNTDSTQTNLVSLTSIDSSCIDSTMCDSPRCWSTYIAIHEISQTQFRSLVDTFCVRNSGDTPPDSLLKTKEQIEALITNQDCETYFVGMTGNPNTLSNATINISIMQTLPPQPIAVRYSIALFKAILDTYSDAKNFYFFKAQHPSTSGQGGRYDIIFEITDVDNNVLYCCDVSDLFP